EHGALLEIECGSREKALLFQETLAPETPGFQTQRSSVSFSCKGPTFHAFIESRDVTALRASINSVFKLLKAAEQAVMA
ncbi:MAG TPA: KEOPS complex subunit Pcc1, partial [archaeon]|nr:KEOPS complex subunit Pcc1 [archaeon]